MPQEVMFNPEMFTRVRKFISVYSPMELDNATKILYARKVDFRCEVYLDETGVNSFAHAERIDIIMNYKLSEEQSILKWLGIPQEKLYIYFDHS
jgi:hypothetical protein